MASATATSFVSSAASNAANPRFCCMSARLSCAVVRAENRRFVGLSLTEGAEKYGFEDAPALAADLLTD